MAWNVKKNFIDDEDQNSLTNEDESFMIMCNVSFRKVSGSKLTAFFRQLKKTSKQHNTKNPWVSSDTLKLIFKHQPVVNKYNTL